MFMFGGEKSYHKWLVGALILTVLFSISIIILYNMRILQTGGEDFKDGLPRKALNINNLSEELSAELDDKGKEGVKKGSKRLRARHRKTPQIKHHRGASLAQETVREVSRALGLLEKPEISNELIARSWRLVTRQVFRKFYEFVYTDQLVLSFFQEMAGGEEPFELLEVWQRLALQKISPALVEEKRKEWPLVKAPCMRFLSYVLQLTFDLEPAEFEEGNVENIRKAQEYIFRRYVLGQTDTELLDDDAYEALLDTLTTPTACETLKHALKRSGPAFVQFIRARPIKAEFISLLDRKLGRLSGAPLLTVLISHLEEPMTESLRTLIAFVWNDPFYYTLKKLLYRLMSWIRAVDGQEIENIRLLGPIVEDFDLLFMDAQGYVITAFRLFFDDLPRRRNELEREMGVRRARDALLLIMKWCAVDVTSLLAFPRTSLPEAIVSLGRQLAELEAEFSFSLGVFYKALYRVCKYNTT